MRTPTRGQVRLGIDVVLHEKREIIQGARIGIVAAAASVDSELVSVVDRLLELENVEVTALFGPEHGLYGEAQAGVEVGDSVHEESGVPVYSLYTHDKRPSANSLAGLDFLVIDLVDVGCRYWTFPYSMAYCLEACKAAGVRVLILDRPNPITGEHVEGNILDPEFSSFVGLYPIPMRTGLTFGESARLFNEHFGIHADLEVVRCAGWERAMWYDETGLPFVPPSPNSPTLDMLTLYPGTCLIEGTNLSEGRGTTRPFEVVGAPWIKPRRLADRLRERALPGIMVRPTYFTPSFSKHKGQVCGGVQIHIVNRDEVHAVRVGIHLLHALMQEGPHVFEWLQASNAPRHIDLLAGTDELRLQLDAGCDPDELLRVWSDDLERFKDVARTFYLY